jgi:hypothetical protein
MRNVTGGAGKSFLFDLPVIPEQRGNLTFAEGRRHVPFAIERIYYLYDVPTGATRAGHAHKTLERSSSRFRAASPLSCTMSGKPAPMASTMVRPPPMRSCQANMQNGGNLSWWQPICLAIRFFWRLEPDQRRPHVFLAWVPQFP